MRQGNGGDEQPQEEVRKVFVEHEYLLHSSQSCLSNILSLEPPFKFLARILVVVKGRNVPGLSNCSWAIRSIAFSESSYKAVRFWRHLFLQRPEANMKFSVRNKHVVRLLDSISSFSRLVSPKPTKASTLAIIERTRNLDGSQRAVSLPLSI